ncbi:hypothetical protein ABZ297_41480 [Nonomuraea sp. NPDC005983]
MATHARRDGAGCGPPSSAVTDSPSWLSATADPCDAVAVRRLFANYE